jgi:SPP1 gp7 family putative phage head morphogenesis protein
MLSMFGQMVAMKFRHAKTTKVRMPMARMRGLKWQWPYNAERSYAAMIDKAMRGFAQALYPSLEQIAKRWATESRDSAGDDLEGLRGEVDRLSAQFFGSDLAGQISDVSRQMDLFGREQFNKFSDLAIGQRWDAHNSKAATAVGDWAKNNYTLVKSLSVEHVKRVNQILTDGVQQGKAWTDIAKEVQAVGPTISKQKSQLIARDQIGKLNSALTASRQQEAGLECYVWQATMDDRTRDSHAEMDGLVCRWDDRSVYSTDEGLTWVSRTTTMPKAHPGEEIQCRCTAAPHMETLFRKAALEVDKEFENPMIERRQEISPAIAEGLERRVRELEQIVEMSNTPYPGIPYNEVTQARHAPKIRALDKTQPDLVRNGSKAGMEYMQNSSAFNKSLREGMAGPEVLEKSKSLTKLIMANRIDYKLSLSRGISYGNWTVGDVIKNKGFTSFSSDELHAISMTKGKKPKYLLRWVAESGASVAPLCIDADGDNVQFNTREREFLGIPGMDFAVVGMKVHPFIEGLLILDVRPME